MTHINYSFFGPYLQIRCFFQLKRFVFYLFLYEIGCGLGAPYKHLREVLLRITHNMFRNKNISLDTPFIWGCG